MEFTVPEEYEALRRRVRAFVERELLPLERTLPEAPDLPDDLRRQLQEKAKAEGLWALDVRREFGGQGLPNLGMVMVWEELGRSTVPPLRAPSVLTPRIGALYHCTPEQRERFLDPIVRGEKRTAFALTEPWGGSDAAGNMRTRAVRDGDHWVLTGRKVFVGGADKADVVQVFALTDPEKRARGGITCFLVERGTPGFRLGRQFQLMVADSPWELIFEECRVPHANVLGPVGEGFRLAQQHLTRDRIFHGAKAVGMAERALELAIDYARDRVTFGAPIAERQAVQWMFAESAMEIHATRLMTYHAAWKLDQGLDVRQEASIVKAFGTEMLGRVTDRALQVFGAIGLSKDLPIERMFRDARSRRIGEGTSEIQRMVIARTLLRDPRRVRLV